MQALIKRQHFPIPLEEAWNFFSDPRNLEKLTPAKMNFRITSDLGDGTTYPGMIITYKVSPLFGIPMTWVTEITQVREREFFIDNQLHGPYKFWHHQHIFKEVSGGVEMVDILYYAAPMGLLGIFWKGCLLRGRWKRFLVIAKRF